MKHALPIMSLVGLVLASVGVGIQYGYPFGCIVAGAILWAEAAIASLSIMAAGRRPSK